MKQTILITGATSGFGKSTATLFASHRYRLILTGRRKDRLEALKESLHNKFNSEIHLCCFDIRDEQACFNAIEQLDESWKSIDVLVNNAGLASGLDKIQEGNTDDWNKMIDTNVKGLLYISKAVIPLMIKRNKGHIVNIGSTAGKEVYEKGTVYCASKFAVDAITKGMRIDLLQHGIKVTQIAPGAAETEFSLVRFHGDKEKAGKVYSGYQPMAAEDIASMVYMVTSLPPHLCINDMVITSVAQANSYYIHRKN